MLDRLKEGRHREAELIAVRFAHAGSVRTALATTRVQV